MGLEPLSLEDIPFLVEHRNDPSTWGNLTDSLPLKAHEQEEWIKKLGTDKMYFILQKRAPAPYSRQEELYKVGIGRITDIDYINRTACVGLDIYRPWRGAGYGSKYFNLLVGYCFNVLNLYRLWLLVLEDNGAAIKIYSKAGFAPEGVMRKHIFKNGTRKDYILMGILRDEYNTIKTLRD